MIAITVEEESDIEKFKDYKASAPASSDETKEPSDSAPPKNEMPEHVSSPEPKISKVDETPQAEDRILVSPLARKLAQDQNVSHFSLCECDRSH